jgi:hypothetical protein
MLRKSNLIFLEIKMMTVNKMVILMGKEFKVMMIKIKVLKINQSVDKNKVNLKNKKIKVKEMIRIKRLNKRNNHKLNEMI